MDRFKPSALGTVNSEKRLSSIWSMMSNKQIATGVELSAIRNRDEQASKGCERLIFAEMFTVIFLKKMTAESLFPFHGNSEIHEKPSFNE